jgi:23S rRNA (cytidine1920-2'-O)/16S rRNA (cytidine1409-2'-O)-methyltransferase
MRNGEPREEINYRSRRAHYGCTGAVPANDGDVQKHVPPRKKTRLDQILVEREFYPSREQAQRAIMAGEVRVNEQIADKASLLVGPEAQIVTAAPPRFVSRGGLKLQGALNHFRIDPCGNVAVDIGASTGGFTDCLLQRGARRIYAVDVGHGQLAWKLRNDPRVVLLEKVNARTSLPGLHQPADLCVIDVSFISLTLILPNAFALLRPGGTVLALIKPQFELERSDVGRGGIVRDTALHEKAQRKIIAFGEQLGWELRGLAPSVITGIDGNQEFFLCARKPSA